LVEAEERAKFETGEEGKPLARKGFPEQLLWKKKKARKEYKNGGFCFAIVLKSGQFQPFCICFF